VSSLLVRSLGGAVWTAALGLFAPHAQAQVFHLYLQCQGYVFAGGPAATKGDAAMAQKPEKAEEEQTVVAAAVKNDGSGDENSKVRISALTRRTAKSSGGAHLELALRDNNMTAFVQRSNVLPTGERMKYTATQTHYAATYTAGPTSRASVDWSGGWLLSWHAPFQKLAATRISIDRQTGHLEGEIVGPAGEVLGLMDMECEPRKEGEGPAPRF
jgi:hypothetical protein